MKTHCWTWIAIGGLAFVGLVGFGKLASDLDFAEAEARRRDARLFAVDARLRAAEEIPREPSAPLPLPPGKHGWRALRVGMTTGQVKGLLGEPDGVEVLWASPKWYYSTDRSDGPYVLFTHQRLLQGWKEPE